MKKLFLFLLLINSQNLFSVQAIISSIKNNTKFKVQFATARDHYNMTFHAQQKISNLRWQIDLDLDLECPNFWFKKSDEKFPSDFIIKKITKSKFPKIIDLKSRDKHSFGFMHNSLETTVIMGSNEAPRSLFYFDHELEQENGIIDLMVLCDCSENIIDTTWCAQLFRCQNIQDNSILCFNLSINSNPADENQIFVKVENIMQNGISTTIALESRAIDESEADILLENLKKLIKDA